MTKIDGPTTGFSFMLKTLYDTEKQLEEALPKMAKAAKNPVLAEGFKQHLAETKEQSRRLEKIFKMINLPVQKHAGKAIRGIISDADTIANADAPDKLKDAMLAGAGREAEHYEMTCYMSAIEEANTLDLTEAADLLEESLNEEEATDKKLEAAFKDNLKEATGQPTGLKQLLRV